MSAIAFVAENELPKAYLPVHTLIYEWTKNADDDLKKDLMRYFHSRNFLDRPNTFFKGRDPGCGKWAILISAAGLDESREMLLKEFEGRDKSFIVLVPNQVPYVEVKQVPRMDQPKAYEKLNKEINKLNKIEKSRNRVKSWQRELNRATMMVFDSAGASQLMKEAMWDKPPPPLGSLDSPTVNGISTSSGNGSSINHKSHQHGETAPSSSAKGPISESSSKKGYWFIAIDVESFEFDHSKVLEIGWSIWDSRHCLFIDKHYAVSDYKHLHNGKYVADRRDFFMFGKTVWAPLKDCIREIQMDLDRGARASTDNKCVFIAHDVSSDEKYLRGLGVQFPETMIKFDTLELNGARLGEDQKTGLGKVLDEVGIENYSLHNAGNDAHYTMALFLWLVQNNARTIAKSQTG